jgi:hypothetical protein
MLQTLGLQLTQAIDVHRFYFLVEKRHAPCFKSSLKLIEFAAWKDVREDVSTDGKLLRTDYLTFIKKAPAVEQGLRMEWEGGYYLNISNFLITVPLSVSILTV